MRALTIALLLTGCSFAVARGPSTWPVGVDLALAAGAFSLDKDGGDGRWHAVAALLATSAGYGMARAWRERSLARAHDAPDGGAWDFVVVPLIVTGELVRRDLEALRKAGDRLTGR